MRCSRVLGLNHEELACPAHTSPVVSNSAQVADLALVRPNRGPDLYGGGDR
jgi:hypothetical protein